MKNLVFLGFIAGVLGTFSAILITDAISFKTNWEYFAVGSVISVIISVMLARVIYGKYMELTKDSQDAIRRAQHAIKNR